MIFFLLKLLQKKVSVRNTRSAVDTSQLVIHRCRNERAKKAFNYAAPSVWNKLPQSIRECATSLTFKKRLKSHLYN